MKKQICFDSDILINFLKGTENNDYLNQALEGEYKGYITSITDFEVNIGILNNQHRKIMQKLTSNFLILAFGKRESSIATNIYFSLKKKGCLIDIKDIFIAASCVSKDMPLVTKNVKHFENIKGLKLINQYSF